MTQKEFNYIKDSFSQILDDIGGNPDWYDAAKAIASDLGTIEKQLEERVPKLPIDELLYQKGYEQAEKDLALTWEDIKLIIAAEGSIYDEHHGNSHEVFETYPTEEEFYGEVLRRYGELKTEKK